jgi:DNA-binding MarR family transcriptional regulator
MGNGDAMSPPLPATPRLERADLVVAALDLLDEKGFERLSVRRLAERIGADPALVRRHFLRRRDLIDAMTASLMKSATRPIMANADWQAVLRHRATVARRAMLSRRDGAFLIARATALFCGRERLYSDSLAAAGFTEDALKCAIELVDRFTLGWVIGEQAGAPAHCDAEARFTARIDTILRALAPEATSAAAPQAASTPYILQLRLWKVLHAARESAEIAYSRTIKLIELDRRILLLLESHGDLVPAEVSASMGVDKAQVSRSVKRLEELGLILRDGVRSPLELTTEGRTLTERMMRLAELRNRELTFGISDEQLVNFFGVVEQLMARAVLLLDQERKLMAAGRTETSLGYDDLADDTDPSNSGGIVVERSRILPPLITLSSYAMRSAALAFKRLTGLSNFESWVLNEIARTPPMEWNTLVQSVNRDQSQAGRTVKRLIDMGLIERDGPPARRYGTFSPTTEGARLHALLEHAGRQRSEFLVQNLPTHQLDTFFSVFEIIAHNAEAQLNRERALDEVERAE